MRRPRAHGRGVGGGSHTCCCSAEPAGGRRDVLTMLSAFALLAWPPGDRGPGCRPVGRGVRCLNRWRAMLTAASHLDLGELAAWSPACACRWTIEFAPQRRDRSGLHDDRACAVANRQQFAAVSARAGWRWRRLATCARGGAVRFALERERMVPLAERCRTAHDRVDGGRRRALRFAICGITCRRAAFARDPSHRAGPGAIGSSNSRGNFERVAASACKKAFGRLRCRWRSGRLRWAPRWPRWWLPRSRLVARRVRRRVVLARRWSRFSRS